MQSTSLRAPLLASLSISTFLVSAVAAQQGTASKPEGNNGRNATPAPNAGRAAELEGLPSFLQVVPGGAVEMGLDAEQFVNASCQAMNPEKPAMAAKIAGSKLGDAMKRAVSMLGRRKVNVETFMLAKWPVKCREYEVLLKKKRDAGGKMRPPLDWWMQGARDDFEKRLPDIKREFPKQENAHIKYWEAHGEELPYAVQDDQGRSIADKPVTTITWPEANEFAGWLGMRLPTEAEWTRAARGDGTQVWPLGTANPPVDAFTDQTLKQLKIYEKRDQVAKDVGTVAAATGPFGHVDMFGQVWQLIGERGYGPIHGADLFAAEWKKLQRDKVGELLQAPPTWRDERVIAKGGSFLSTNDPIQLAIDARAPMNTNEPLQSLGFRLAKSLKPGYDMLYSLLRGTYNRAPFTVDQDVALASQTGAERYELGADGFPTAYHAISFASVNWLSRDKNAELGKMIERSQTVPMLIGTLAVTEPLADPATPAGLYSVLYRREGIPRELSEALKTGHKEATNAMKAKARGEEPEAPAEQENDKKDKKESWRSVTSRFGLTLEDVASKDVADGTIKFVRVEGRDVPTDRDVFLLHDNAGKIVAVLPADGCKPVMASGAVPSKLVIEAGDSSNPATKGKTVCKFEVGAGLSQTSPKKLVELHFKVTVDMPPPAADKPWRLPVPAK